MRADITKFQLKVSIGKLLVWRALGRSKGAGTALRLYIWMVTSWLMKPGRPKQLFKAGSISSGCPLITTIIKRVICEESLCFYCNSAFGARLQFVQVNVYEEKKILRLALICVDSLWRIHVVWLRSGAPPWENVLKVYIAGRRCSINVQGKEMGCSK